MKTPFSYSKLHNHVASLLFKRAVIYGLYRSTMPARGKALIYHKTDSLTPGYIQDYVHTNHWEITCQVNILNQLGYAVDVIDRSVSPTFTPSDTYDIFIGSGADDSGRHYARFAKSLSRAVKILYAACAEPTQRNEAVRQRYANFQQRTGHRLTQRRLVQHVHMDESMAYTDYVLYAGNEVTLRTFSAYQKPFYRLHLSTAPNLTLNYAAIAQKSSREWLFFAGNGNILKGLDLALEVFAAQPTVKLTVCTTLEDDFLDYYRPLLAKAKNIEIKGYVRVGSALFKELTNRSAFIISPSASEGQSTSVTSCMRRGLIPVITPATGIDVGEFGWLLHEPSIEALQQLVTICANTPALEVRRRSMQSYLASLNYTQAGYFNSFTRALLDILAHADRL